MMFRKSVFNKRKFLIIRRHRRRNQEESTYVPKEEDKVFEFHEEESHHADEISSFDAEELFPSLVEEGQVPSFFHIGFYAKDCLVRGYKIGVWNIDCSTIANDTVSLYSYGQARPTVQNVSGGVGMRETFGMWKLTQAWQTEGLMATCGILTALLGGNLYGLLRGTYAPPSYDTRDTRMSQMHAGSNVTLEVHSGFDNSFFRTEIILPILRASKLLGYVLVRPLDELLLGIRAVFDVDHVKFDKHVLCAGYDDLKQEYGLKLENFKNLRGSIFRQITDKWAVALKGNIIGEDMCRFDIGGQYQFDDNIMLKAKLRNDGMIGFVWQQKAKDDEIEIMYHIGFDLRAPISGAHKIGVSYSFRDG